MTSPYNFQDFLERMARLDYHDILREADAECGRVQKVSSRVRGAPRQRKMGSLQYLQRIKEFLFFMQHGIRPATASESDFQSYRPVVETLVEKGQIKPETLEVFRQSAP